MLGQCGMNHLWILPLTRLSHFGINMITPLVLKCFSVEDHGIKMGGICQQFSLMMIFQWLLIDWVLQKFLIVLIVCLVIIIGTIWLWLLQIGISVGMSIVFLKKMMY